MAACLRQKKPAVATAWRLKNLRTGEMHINVTVSRDCAQRGTEASRQADKFLATRQRNTAIRPAQAVTSIKRLFGSFSYSVSWRNTGFTLSCPKHMQTAISGQA
jgi:hypothetical protein